MCNFRDPNLVTFYLCSYLILNEEHFTFHLKYKHSGKFANRKYEELSYPEKSENVRPHSSNSIENATPFATPSSGTSPLASYKEVLPPPPPLVGRGPDTSTLWKLFIACNSLS